MTACLTNARLAMGFRSQARRHHEQKKAPGAPGLEANRKENFETARQYSQSVRRAIRKGLRRAAIALSYRHYVAAYPPGRIHRAVSSN
jgi:hypothetical protein